MTALTPDDKLRRANEARAIADNPLFREACEVIEARAMEAVIQAPAELRAQVAAEAVALVSAARALRQHVLSAITDGAQAERRARPASHV